MSFHQAPGEANAVNTESSIFQINRLRILRQLVIQVTQSTCISFYNHTKLVWDIPLSML